MSPAIGRVRYRWLAPEVIQTSAMDCGPAALKCLLEGFGVPVGYGRLREACQTDVDGTSVDVIESVARRLGVDSQQLMIPVDHVFLPDAAALPALIVTQRADGATHFVVVWRRHGGFVQIMDPAVGRRWVRWRRFAEDIYRHRFEVSAADWQEWAATEEFLAPLRARLDSVGIRAERSGALIDRALAATDWRPLGALDAATRLVESLVRVGGLERGERVGGFLDALLHEAGQESQGTVSAIPVAYWSVLPASGGAEPDERVVLQGAVLVRVRGRLDSSGLGEGVEDVAAEPLSPELAAAVAEKSPRPVRTLLGFLKLDGILTPLALLGAMVLAVGAVLVETVLFRGMFDLGRDLGLVSQRLGAVAALMAFLFAILLLELAIAWEALRLGRHLEIRLRMALARKLSVLGDRYFQSRPVSDMAERSHNLHLIRLVPELAIHMLRACFDLLFTLVGIAMIDPASMPLAGGMVAVAIGVPWLAQPVLSERDLRVRSHSGALAGFYLDALLGLIPVRTHRAELAVRSEHESRLVEWARSARDLVCMSLIAQAGQAGVCLSLGGWLLWDHFQRAGITGGVLLLVYWTLKLPALGQRLTGLARQYPAQRNVLLRLLEPLGAPEEIDAPTRREYSGRDRGRPAARTERSRQAARVTIRDGTVLAAGHAILRDIDLSIEPGEHVAIVGPSGAGKSSLIGLLLGWHRLEKGTLLVDGESLTGSRLAALREEIAWVDPSIQIWNRSLLENLQYSAADGSQEELGRTLEGADLRRVLKKLPEGLQTQLGEGGGLLSGGEGQRVRLGRTLRQSSVRLALLDEPFRGLDRHQRQQLLRKAQHWWWDSTMLCVTHDIAETLIFDRVLVVDEGRIVEDGSPGLLAARSSRYRDLLETERAVRRGLWESDRWRRVRVEDGMVRVDQAEEETRRGHRQSWLAPVQGE